MSVKFNILGACILRDIFGLRDDEGGVRVNEFQVLRFTQFTNPLTWFIFNEKPDREMLYEEIEHVQLSGKERCAFDKKCIIRDYNKSVLSYYDEKSDYFLLDLVEVIFPIIKLKIDEKEHYFSYSSRLTQKVSSDKRFVDLLEGEKEVISCYTFDETYIRKTCQGLVDWLINIKGYRPEQIILVKNQHVCSYSDNDKLYQFEYKDELIRQNEYMNQWYTVFNEFLPKCNVIEFPTNAFATTTHKWGLTSLHYVYDVYDYYYEAINVIVTHQDPSKIKYYYNRCNDLLGEKLEQLKTGTVPVKFYVTYNANCNLKGEIPATMEVTVGKPHRLSRNTFINPGHIFLGWKALRMSDNKTCYINPDTGERRFFLEGKQPEGYKVFLYTEKNSVSALSRIKNDIVTMYAQWKPIG